MSHMGLDAWLSAWDAAACLLLLCLLASLLRTSIPLTHRLVHHPSSP